MNSDSPPTPSAETEMSDKDAELCAKCGFTLYNHLSNTGVVYPCWSPSGRFSEDRTRNHPTVRALGADDWCECQHPDHFDSGKDEHTYGAHIKANVTMANGARFCAKCAAYHPAAARPVSPTAPAEMSLEQRFALKESVVRLRGEIEEAHRADPTNDWCVTTVRASDVHAVLDEIDRLMLVNGQIAKLWCDSEDRASPVAPTADFKELLDALLDRADDAGFSPANEGFKADLREAREALEDYVARLRAEIMRLELEAARFRVAPLVGEARQAASKERRP